MNAWFYRYRHELAHDGQRIYILGGGTSWTSYPLGKVRGTSTVSPKNGVLLLHVVYFYIICLHQIHAYNLETNYWEEIVTKPHEKIGLWSMFSFLFFFLLNKGFEDHTEFTLFVIIMTGYPAARRCHSCVQIKDGKEYFTLHYLDAHVWNVCF